MTKKRNPQRASRSFYESRRKCGGQGRNSGAWQQTKGGPKLKRCVHG